jgi:hypothetical protein
MRAHHAVRRAVLGVVALCWLGAAAAAQTPTVRLTAEDTHTIKEIVLKESGFPRTDAADYKVGDPVPAAVALQSFPSILAEKISATKSHKFFLSGNKVVVVDPKDNKVAEVIE